MRGLRAVLGADPLAAAAGSALACPYADTGSRRFQVGAAHDVRTRSFSTSVMGYDRGEVEAFRQDVADMIDDLQERIGALQRKVREFEQAKPITADQAFAQVARETQRVLQVAQDAGARLLQQAREAGGVRRFQEILLDVEGDPPGALDDVERRQERLRRDVAEAEGGDDDDRCPVSLREGRLVGGTCTLAATDPGTAGRRGRRAPARRADGRCCARRSDAIRRASRRARRPSCAG